MPKEPSRPKKRSIPTSRKKRSDSDFLELAYEEALKALKKDEVPVGAVIVKDGEVLSRAHNLKEQRQDVLAHAELIALQKAQKKLGTWRLEGCSLFVTLEPCIVCASALQHARVDRVVYGVPDLKGGAVSLEFNIHNHPKLNHRFLMEHLNDSKCGQILSDFFRMKRKLKKA